MENLPTDYFITSTQFTKTTHRDVYPAIDPTKTPALSQAGKVIAITGPTRGLGRRGFVKQFAKSHPKGIVLIGRSESEIAAVAEEVHAIDPKIQVLEAAGADLKDEASIKNVWAKVKHTFGHADVLIANAAIFEKGRIVDTKPEDWWRQMEVNFKGTYLHVQNFLSLLPSPETRATIVALVSTLAILVNPYLSSHSISKLATQQLLSFVSAEHPNVLAVGVHPGIVDTDMLQPTFQRFKGDTPELVGGLAVWIASHGNRGDGDFLKGRFINANWDVTELEQRKEEILKERLLTVGLQGKFGKEQFD